MAKYSTGNGGGGDSGGACELCGREDTKLSRATVAGANLLVCGDCAPHDDDPRRNRGSGGNRGGSGSGSGSRDADEPSRAKRRARNAARVMDASAGDSRHWEEKGTDYESDRLPYLVKGYGERAANARQEAGLTPEELAEMLAVDVETVHAVEEGRASRAGVGGSVVRAIENELDVTLVDE